MTTPRGNAPAIPPRVNPPSSTNPSTPTASHPLMTVSPPPSTSPQMQGFPGLAERERSGSGAGIGSAPSTPRGKGTGSARNSVNLSDSPSDNLLSSQVGTPRGMVTTPSGTKMPPSSSTPRLDSLEAAASPQLSHSQMPRSFSLPQQMNLTEGKVEDAMPDMVIKSKLSSDEVSGDENGLKILMKNGSWRSVLKLADRCITTTTNPQLILQYKLCKAVSLTKTRNYKNALDEINGIGDFNDPVNCFETYTSLFPGKKGSMVPFSLLILKAELLYVLGTDQSLDPLYNLLSYCRREIDRLKHEAAKPATSHGEPLSPPLNINTPSSPTPHASADDLSETASPVISVWREREKKITLLIATHLVALKDYLQALSLIEPLATSGDVNVLAALGRIHLQLGCIKNAQLLFSDVERKVNSPNTNPLVLMNRGYMHLATDQYGKAIDSFDAVLQLEPSNIAAANNRSICWLYTCELTKAITSLENLIQRDPENNLDESLIFNLCTLYDLASDKSTDKKKSIMGLVAKYAPDNFDFRVFKINS